MICCKFVAIWMSIGYVLLGNSIDVNVRERERETLLWQCEILAHTN